MNTIFGCVVQVCNQLASAVYALPRGAHKQAPTFTFMEIYPRTSSEPMNQVSIGLYRRLGCPSASRVPPPLLLPLSPILIPGLAFLAICWRP